MTIEDRINAFSKLGNYILTIDKGDLDALIDEAKTQNAWFTSDNIKLALSGLASYLDHARLKRWTSAYSTQREPLKTVGIIMAGNVPFVGFHDLLSVFISGNKGLIKLSSKDSILIPYMIAKLGEFEPAFNDRVVIAEQLKGFEAVIATGSDNSARYFEYYFAKYPHIIRKNRTSCAILVGNETEAELKQLGTDIFSHFGLGCRNVSKIYVPDGYNFATLFEPIESFNQIIHHHKYHNNYDYQKSIMLINNVRFLDNGFLMVTENERMVSPISVLYYERYRNLTELKSKLALHESRIQCIVGKTTPATISFGQAQFPELWDYADQIDTLKFLTSL
jgi:hypothetical protein